MKVSIELLDVNDYLCDKFKGRWKLDKWSLIRMSDIVVGQYMIAASAFGDFPLTLGKKREVTNIVYMGQGEPLYNWK